MPLKSSTDIFYFLKNVSKMALLCNGCSNILILKKVKKLRGNLDFTGPYREKRSRLTVNGAFMAGVKKSYLIFIREVKMYDVKHAPRRKGRCLLDQKPSEIRLPGSGGRWRYRTRAGGRCRAAQGGLTRVGAGLVKGARPRNLRRQGPGLQGRADLRTNRTWTC